MLRLYVDAQYFSPYALSAFVALSEKGLPFEPVAVDLSTGQQHEADFSNLSLTRRVPVLVDGDFALSESSAIIEYLEEAFPDTPRIYPVDAKQRARARQLQAWLRSDLLPLRVERTTEVVFLRPVAKPLSESAQAAADKLVAVAERLIPADGGNLFGDWCIADVDLALMLKRLQHNGDPLPAKLARYADRQWQRPAVQTWLGLGRERSVA